MRFSPPTTEQLAEHLSALLRGSRDWRLVSSFLDEAPRVAASSERMAWSQLHSHAHPYRELLVPLAGECQFGWRGRIIACRPGTAVLCDSNESHDLQYPASSAPLVHLWMTVSPGDCLGSAIWMRGRIVPFWRVHVSTAESHTAPCLDRLWTLAREEHSLLSRERLLAGLHLLLAEIADRARNPEHAAGDTREQCVRIACRMLDEVHGVGLDLAALAKASGYSKCYFHRLFHAQTGMTVHRYADERRAARARDLVAVGLPRKEIAYELGFSSPSAFCRWFHHREQGG